MIILIIIINIVIILILVTNRHTEIFPHTGPDQPGAHRRPGSHAVHRAHPALHPAQRGRPEPINK